MIYGLFFLSLILLGFSFSAPVFSCRFGRKQWSSDDWIMVKCPRWPFFQERWLQEDDCIRNPTPDKPINDWLTPNGDESYTSMVYRNKFQGDFTLKMTLAFEPQMAPLIVLADDLGQSKNGRPEYRNSLDIVFFNEGVNVWTNTCSGKNAISTFRLTAFNRFPLKPKTRYGVEVSKKDKTLTIKVDGHCFGVFEPQLPAACYLGITGCEGFNRFYDFSVAPLDPKNVDFFISYAYDQTFTEQA